MSGLEDKLSAILGNQEAMGQIMALARSLEGQGEPPAPPEEACQAETQQEEQPPLPDLSAVLGSIDPNMMQLGMRLLQEYNRADDRNTALLLALRPFVKEERFAKVDRAIRIARLSRLIRVFLDAMKEKGAGGFV